MTVLNTKLVDGGGGYIAQLKVGGDGMTSDANYERQVPYETFDTFDLILIFVN